MYIMFNSNDWTNEIQMKVVCQIASQRFRCEIWRLFPVKDAITDGFTRFTLPSNTLLFLLVESTVKNIASC